MAVLAVDPSSQRSGGSILGDKTRMEQLSRAPEAFIRPSPTAGTLGGVARRTREVLLACEAAGFDVVLIETVGVGQSETAVADLVDMFLLLLLPGGGDELQGIKRGIMELADLLVVNKADGDMAAAAQRSAGEYANAIRLLHPTTSDWIPPVLTCSSLENIGIDDIREMTETYRKQVEASGMLEERPGGGCGERSMSICWLHFSAIPRSRRSWIPSNVRSPGRRSRRPQRPGPCSRLFVVPNSMPDGLDRAPAIA